MAFQVTGVEAQELDDAVEAFRARPLHAGQYTFVADESVVAHYDRASLGTPLPWA